VVFPVHPRTAKNLRELDSKTPQLNYVDPLGYLEFNYLVKHAKGVITDSGGITEETTVLGVPCSPCETTPSGLRPSRSGRMNSSAPTRQAPSRARTTHGRGVEEGRNPSNVGR